MGKTFADFLSEDAVLAIRRNWQDFSAEVLKGQPRYLHGGHLIDMAGYETFKELMLKDVNWLVLDEPTNHLDVDAKDELKRALKEFKGSVLLVSHEPEFYEDWVDKVWNIEDWTTKII